MIAINIYRNGTHISAAREFDRIFVFNSFTLFLSLPLFGFVLGGSETINRLQIMDGAVFRGASMSLAGATAGLTQPSSPLSSPRGDSDAIEEAFEHLLVTRSLSSSDQNQLQSQGSLEEEAVRNAPPIPPPSSPPPPLYLNYFVVSFFVCEIRMAACLTSARVLCL